LVVVKYDKDEVSAKQLSDSIVKTGGETHKYEVEIIK